MSLIEILIVALGLSADAFAVSIAAGSSGHADAHRPALRLAFHLGLFQFLMPVAGWYLGMGLEQLIQAIDHWIAFGLLAVVGGRMILAAFSAEGTTVQTDPTKGMSLVMLSLATSIDAFAVGMSLALFRVEVWQPGIIIGLVTASLSFVGVRLGGRIRNSVGRSMEIVGGLVLIAIGVRILYEHMSL